MKILELRVAETLTLAPDIRVTVLNIAGNSARLQIDAPAHMTITIGNSPDPSAAIFEDPSSDGNGT